MAGGPPAGGGRARRPRRVRRADRRTAGGRRTACLWARGGADHDARRRPVDREIEFVWSANMAIRRSALERVGEFDETIQDAARKRNGSGVTRPPAGASSTSPRPRRASPRRRRRDRRRSVARLLRTRPDRASQRRAHGRGPTLPAELRTLAGCVWHTGRRRCANGIVMAAHSLGRVRETLAEGRS